MATKFIALLSLAVATFAGDTAGNWVAAWTASPADAGVVSYAVLTPGSLRNRTVRNAVHLSLAASTIRLRLSNTLGTENLSIEEVDAGIQQSGATLVRGSTRTVTFNGARRVTIPSGATALSDPVSLAITRDQNLAVSIFSTTGGTITLHPAAFQDTFISAGNVASREDAATFSAGARAWCFLIGVDVLAAPNVKGTIVALGDSITDGDGSTPNANRRWPDLLVRRLNSEFAVVNAGIGGNRVLGNSPCFGIGAVARLDRDVFSQTSARAVIFLEGINDIIQPDYAASHKTERIAPCLGTTQVTADDLIAAYRQVIAQAHAKGLRIYGGTLTPYQGFVSWTQNGEAKRLAVNRWIKTGGAFDGVIDFAAAVADPGHPARLARGRDSGDHVHPNDAGYAAMAAAVDLTMLRRGLQ